MTILPNIAHPPEARLEVYAAAQVRLVRLEPDPEKQSKYAESSPKGAVINGWRLTFWLAVAVAGVGGGGLTPTSHLPPLAFDSWDKVQHTAAFFLLAWLGFLAFRQRRMLVLAGLLAYGGVIELAQAATGWRGGDWLDWLADVVGVDAVYLWSRYLRNRGRVLHGMRPGGRMPRREENDDQS